MIECLDLKNFTAFHELNIEFSPKITVFLGENSTGKTHLLKAAYALCTGASLFKHKSDIGSDELETALTAKLLRLFMPLDDKLGKVHRRGATEQGYLRAQFVQDAEIVATFFNNSKALAIQSRRNYERYRSEAVFIPTKEVLSFMKGFTSLYEKYGLAFDQTYQDLCLLLDLPEIRPDALHEKSKWAITEIQNLCGGHFVFDGGGKVNFKTEYGEYSVNAMAEGFRKVGLLSRLLETGAITPGVSGPLFWDEPESNLNPKMMKLLVQIMLELSRHGQQIIVATHDYVLLKWFDLLVNKGKGDHILFYSLYRDPDSSDIKASVTEDYLDIHPNPIDEAFGFLLNQEIEKDMKGMGK